MRRSDAHGNTEPGPGADSAGPVFPTAPPPEPRRKRGRHALTGLTSTDDFTNARTEKNPGGRLREPDCTLRLFCLACLVDDEGALTTAYQKLIRAHGATSGHWCHGKTLDPLRRTISKFLGRGADRIPGWQQIADLLTAALPAEQLPVLLPQAAALYCRATGDPRPPGYSGGMVTPAWVGPPVVATTVITTAIARQRAALSTDVVPLGAVVVGDTGGTEPAPRLPREHNAQEIWSVLKHVVRDWRAAKNAYDQQSKRMVELEKMVWQLTTQNHALAQAAEDALAAQGLTPAFIHQALYGVGKGGKKLTRLPLHRNGWTMSITSTAATPPA
ncbi:hypothetical protein AB0F91_44670 [Amycolatopsis sp. NPDC023774]|uniref:hypothetical protein n=1 Tax=Amycolatopsis sp. NPDC023774 TaxID=3155015 RepID=UPI00340E010C